MKKHSKLWLLPIISGLLLSVTCGPNKTIVGSGTETGNVTGKVVTTAHVSVAGAKVSLFLKKTSISSPTDSAIPVKEIYSNDTGYFSLTMENGNYTIVATSDSQYAFVDNVIPGNENAKGMQVVLKKPGTLTGEISNSIELRGTGSIVAHLIGTAIFQNVETDGTFSITNIPAGTYTLVSYSTYQPEFSPNYKQVIIYPDSTTDLGKYSLTYNGIPIPKNIKVKYDTAFQVVRISWDSISNFKDFQEYAILRGQGGLTEHNLKQIGYSKENSYVDSIFFTSEQPVTYEYSVLIHNKLGDAGKYYGIYSLQVMPYKTVIPKIDTLRAVFDTVKGVATISWDSVKTFDGFGGYILARSIIKKFKSDKVSDTIIDTISKSKSLTYSDSLYTKTLAFSDSGIATISYNICAYHKDWNLYGRSTSAKLLTINPYYKLVPLVDSVIISYDTLKGTLHIAWDSLKSISGLDGFVVSRKIINSEAGINKNDTFSIKNIISFTDSIYPQIVSLDKLGATTVSYSISAKHKEWGITGESQNKSIQIFSFKKYIPVVSAGQGQTVDISSEVLLQGIITSRKWPIAKMEWKIGDGKWVVCDSGKTTFTTNSSYDKETIVCMFRATDSVGNVGIDTVSVFKQQLVVTFGKFPSKTIPIQGSHTVVIPKTGKCWFIGDIDYNKYAVWSTQDFVAWKIENPSPGIQNIGESVVLDGVLFSMGIGSWYGSKCYTSIDGISWEEIPANLPEANRTNICALNGKMYTICQNNGNDTLFTSSDGIIWNRAGLALTDNPGALVAHDQNLYFATQYETKRLQSSDFGLTWSDAPLWDNNYTSFPDDCYQLISNDSVVVAYYNERPAGIRKISMLREGVWTNVPIDGLGISQNYYDNVFFIFKNRLMYINRSSYDGYYSFSYSIKSIKLY